MARFENITLRPSKLNQVIGQDLVTKALAKCLASDNIPSAFLFYGIRGIGKTTLARILAFSMTCKTPIDGEACGSCKSCEMVRNGSHLDIMELDAASRTGVDDIREIINACQYTPVIGRYKVFIIDEVHMLSKSAFNALLKTLEEPPSHVRFIFATTEVGKIPDTILSRCLAFNLRPLSVSALSKYLVEIANKDGIDLSQEASELIADESSGSVRDALSLLKQAVLLSNSVTADVVTSIVGKACLRDIKNLLKLITDGKVSDASICVNGMLSEGADAISIYKQLQKELYLHIVESLDKSDKGILTKLLYLWQILLKQTENINNATYTDCVLGAVVIMLAHAANFPDISAIINNTCSDNNIVDKILAQFPKSTVIPVE